MAFTFTPHYGHFKPITMHERYVQRSTQKALKHPPVGLFFREHAVNIMELLPQLAKLNITSVTATYTAVKVNGVAKLAMIDNGPGIPSASSDPERVTLENFPTFIGMTDETKGNGDDHEHRGLRFLLGHTSKEGVIVYSKQVGEPVYMTAFGVNPATDELGCITVDAQGRAAHEVTELPDELQQLGDHWTAFIVLGNKADSETAYIPFKGADQIDGLHVGSQLTRRIAALPKGVDINMDWQKLFADEKTTNFSGPFVPIMDYFDLHKMGYNPDVRPKRAKAIRKWSVKTKEGPIIHWIVNPKGSKARVGAVNNIELGTFGGLVFHKDKSAGLRISEFMDYHEATAKEAHSSWAAESAYFEGLGEISDRLSLVIEVSEKDAPIEQILGRTALGFNSENHPYETFIGQDYRCTLRSFRSLEKQYRPKSVQSLISRSLEEDDPDDEKALYDDLANLFQEMRDLFMIKARRGPKPDDEPEARRGGRFSSILRRRGGTPGPFRGKGFIPDPTALDWIDGPLPKFIFKLVDFKGDDLLKNPMMLREDLENRTITLEMNINHYLSLRALDLAAGKAGFIRWDLTPQSSRQSILQKINNAGTKVFFRYWLFVTGDAAKGYMTSAEKELALTPPSLKLQLGLYHHWYEEVVSRVKVSPQKAKAREQDAIKRMKSEQGA